MSFMDKIKEFFSGGSAAGSDSSAGMDPIAEPASTPMGDPAAAPVPPMPAADPVGMPTSDAPEQELAGEHDDQETDHSGHDHSGHDHTH